jgi:uncharacterized membrane protein
VDRKVYSAKWYAIVPATLAVFAVAVPVLMARVPEVGLALQRGFSLVCHQHAERSFVLFGGTVAVCARCLGIYLGTAAGLLLRLPGQLAWRFLLAALAANLIDWTAELAGLHGNWMLARFVLGFTLGMAGAMMVASFYFERKLATSH